LLSFLIISLVTASELTERRSALISALIFLPMAIFAASLVRFTFLALAGSLCLAIIISEAKQRWHIVGIALVVLIATATGLIARSNSYAARTYANYAIEESSGDVELAKRESSDDVKLAKRKTTGDVELAKTESTHDMELVKLPSCYLTVDLQNSIAVRKMIARDALVLIPSAGWIGLGLDSFMKLSCIKLTEVHNSILQAAVEFGWLGGLLLFLLIVLVGSSILVAARHDGASRFVLCSLAFIVLESLAHGRISRDAVLFAFLGCAVGLKETSGGVQNARMAKKLNL
jgi:hypothetical protein